MTPEKLAAKLRSMYDNHPGETSAMILLFGILYADQLKNCGATAEQIANSAIPTTSSYGTEIRKGMKLARYVQLKEKWASDF